jgi:hypothetical protein
MSEINLLPQELKPSGSILKLSKNLKNIALLAVVVLLLFVTLSLGAYFILDNRTSASAANQEGLKQQIRALQQTEQRLVLIKDRLGKINSISKGPRANDEVERLNIVSTLFPENTYVEAVELDVNNAAVAISSDTLDNIAAYLASVVSSGEYIQINLAFLEYDPKQGYVVGLVFPE